MTRRAAPSVSAEALKEWTGEIYASIKVERLQDAARIHEREQIRQKRPLSDGGLIHRNGERCQDKYSQYKLYDGFHFALLDGKASFAKKSANGTAAVIVSTLTKLALPAFAIATRMKLRVHCAIIFGFSFQSVDAFVL